MKQKYDKPAIEIVGLEVTMVMMAESVSTEVGNTPSCPDANVHRGTWGNLWNED